MQLVGFQSWEQNPTAETITLEDVRFGAALARRNFTERILDATYYDLSPNDVRFLQAMLDDERESRTTDIASRLGETTNYTSTYKRRLIEPGVIGEGALLRRLRAAGLPRLPYGKVRAPLLTTSAPTPP